MGRKYKMTGCAKFAIVLIILAPIAYIGASYFNGEDGIQNIKDLFGMGKAKVEEMTGSSSQSDDDAETVDQSLMLKQKQKTIDSLKAVNQQLQQELNALKSAETSTDSLD